MRWQDLTPAQVDALSLGPVQWHERPLTEAEIASGMQGKAVSVPVRRKVVVRSYAPSDPMFLCDSDGERFMIGEYEDGSFFKEPLSF